MPYNLDATFTLPDNVVPEEFLLALAVFAEQQGVTIARHSRSREFSVELERLGLDRGLNTRLTRLNIFSAADLEGFSETELDALPYIGPGSIRQVILALAAEDPPKALKGNPVIPLADLVENLDLFPDNYWLLKSRYSRLSELTAIDMVAAESLEDELGLPFRLLKQAMERAGLQFAPLDPTRTLTDLRLTTVVVDIVDTLAEAGFGSGEPLGNLTVGRLREGLEGLYPSGQADRLINRIRAVLRAYRFELPA